MKNDPFNQLPIDPEWVRLADQLTAEAAQKLGGMVLLVVVQPGGKMGIQIDGVPPAGPLREMAGDVPRLLHMLADICKHMDECDAAEPPGDKH